MSDEELKQEMWRIDVDATLDRTVSEYEKKFFNENIDRMKEILSDELDHWKHHTSKFKIKPTNDE